MRELSAMQLAVILPITLIVGGCSDDQCEAEFQFAVETMSQEITEQIGKASLLPE